MNRAIITGILSALTLIFAVTNLPAEDSDSSTKQVKYNEPTDQKRVCEGRDKHKKKSETLTNEDGLILPESSWGNNPQEKEYREEVTRLLKLEISNVKDAVTDVAEKHRQLIELYPKLKTYQEIVIEDNPGSWRDGVYVNSKKVLAMHYDDQGEMTCLVLDSMTRGVYQTAQWTRKIIKLHYPYVQTMEIYTERQNFKDDASLEHTSPEVQLKAFRLVFSNLRTALYSMDMMIAAFYDRNRKIHEWQINL